MDKQIQDLIHSIYGALPEELIGGIQRLLNGRDRELASSEDLLSLIHISEPTRPY